MIGRLGSSRSSLHSPQTPRQFLQSSQSPPGILNLGETGVGVFPEVEQSMVALYGFAYYYSQFIFFNQDIELTI